MGTVETTCSAGGGEAVCLNVIKIEIEDRECPACGRDVVVSAHHDSVRHLPCDDGEEE